MDSSFRVRVKVVELGLGLVLGYRIRVRVRMSVPEYRYGKTARTPATDRASTVARTVYTRSLYAGLSRTRPSFSSELQIITSCHAEGYGGLFLRQPSF